jgi:hypothetical protein
VIPIDASKLIKEKPTSASGKPLLVHRDPNFAGHVSIKIASDDAPAHLLRYKPEFESELPFLPAFSLVDGGFATSCHRVGAWNGQSGCKPTAKRFKRQSRFRLKLSLHCPRIGPFLKG